MIEPRDPDRTLREISSSDVRSRLAIAALELFERQGFEATTVDDIAAVVGVSRRTFFRHFAAKEDAIFTDQPELLAKLRSGLEYGMGEPVAVAGHALGSLLDEVLLSSELFHRRDALVLATPALADRELVWWGEYQQILGEHLGKETADAKDLMFAKIVAAAMLAAFRQVVTAWIRTEDHDNPKGLFAELTDDITESMSAVGPRGAGPAPGHPERRDVLIITSDLSGEQIAELLERHHQ